MSSSKPLTGNDDVLGESWVEVDRASSTGGGTPGSVCGSVTHQMSVQDYLKLLKEAQDSNPNSCRDSITGSRRESPRGSPKSPPNSPVIQGTPLSLDWQTYYVNSEGSQDLISMDWSSRPDSIPKPWSFRSSSHKYDLLSLRYAKIGSTPLFSKRGLCIMFLTNLISLLLGTGVGLFLNRHGFNPSVPAIKVR